MKVETLQRYTDDLYQAYVPNFNPLVLFGGMMYIELTFFKVKVRGNRLTYPLLIDAGG